MMASIPVMITGQMEQKLRALGYDDVALRTMTPIEANEILSANAQSNGRSVNAQQPQTNNVPSDASVPQIEYGNSLSDFEKRAFIAGIELKDVGTLTTLFLEYTKLCEMLRDNRSFNLDNAAALNHTDQTYNEASWKVEAINTVLQRKAQIPQTTFQAKPLNGRSRNSNPPQWLSLDEITLAFERGETGDAELLASLYTDKIAYDHAEKQWYFFEGHTWTPDLRKQIIHLVANQVAAQYLYAAGSLKALVKADDTQTQDRISELYKRANGMRFKGRIDRVLDLAAKQPTLALIGNEWDANSMLLACLNGVLDLRADSFAFRDGQPKDYIRTVAPVEWKGLDAAAPRWEKFVRQILDEENKDATSAEQTNFLQRWSGYCISGKTSEDTFVVLYGEEGRNGKRVFTESIAGVIGPYAHIGDEDLLIQTRGRSAGSPKQFLIDLAGKRMVLMSETEEGARFNLARVKQLTGSDIITARGMYQQKGQQLPPTWKIVLSTNRMPHATEDDAFYSRLAIVKFTQRFVENPTAQNEHQRDPKLIETLRAEASGILAWLVRGVLEWQQSGLNPPESVRMATKDYREQESDLSNFISEKCVIHPNAVTRANDLFIAYKNWAASYQMPHTLDQKNFSKQMVKTYTREKKHDGWYYKGIGVCDT